MSNVDLLAQLEDRIEQLEDALRRVLLTLLIALVALGVIWFAVIYVLYLLQV
jgi:hypothetical protein